jgi:hypothetical protein
MSSRPLSRRRVPYPATEHLWQGGAGDNGIGGGGVGERIDSPGREPGQGPRPALAVADRHVLFVTSANLTQSGVAKNIEAGLLVRGGTAPARRRACRCPAGG